MRTRSPHPSEPDSAPILYRLGMTRGALIAVVLLTVAALIGFWRLQTITNQNHELARQGVEAQRALCAVQISTRGEVRASIQYLSDLKAGRRQPIRGISETDILTSISRQQKFLKALDELDC